VSKIEEEKKKMVVIVKRFENATAIDQSGINKRLDFGANPDTRQLGATEGYNRGGDSEEDEDDDDETIFQSFEDLDAYEEEKVPESGRRKAPVRTLSIHQTNTQFTSLVRVNNSCLWIFE